MSTLLMLEGKTYIRSSKSYSTSPDRNWQRQFSLFFCQTHVLVSKIYDVWTAFEGLSLFSGQGSWSTTSCAVTICDLDKKKYIRKVFIDASISLAQGRDPWICQYKLFIASFLTFLEGLWLSECAILRSFPRNVNIGSKCSRDVWFSRFPSFPCLGLSCMGPSVGQR